MGLSFSRGIQPISSKEYVEREKEKQIPTHLYVHSLSLPHLCFFIVQMDFLADMRTLMKKRWVLGTIHGDNSILRDLLCCQQDESWWCSGYHA